MEAGKPYNLLPMGMLALDRARIEAGLPLFCHFRGLPSLRLRSDKGFGDELRLDFNS
jgi:hypothetical protein